MKKNIIVGIAWVVGIVALLMLLGFNLSLTDTVSDNSRGVLELDKTFHEFGTIDIFGGDVAADFTLTNTGDEPVTILSGTTSCGCTQGEISSFRFGMHTPIGRTITINPGESETLVAIYDPLAHGPNATGKVTRELILTTNSNETPEIRTRISADVINAEQ